MVVDKCKNEAEIEDFNQYLSCQLEAKLPLNIPLNILTLVQACKQLIYFVGACFVNLNVMIPNGIVITKIKLYLKLSI